MKYRQVLSLAVVLLWPSRSFSQGTLIYDQQSAASFTPGSGFPITQNQPMGQSFTPTLPAVGFVQLELWEVPPSPSIQATIAVNLWGDSLGGTFLGSTDAVVLPADFYGVTNFFFSPPVSVVPGTKYYFQPVIQSGGDNRWSILADTYNYSAGTLIVQGQPDGNNNDAWFREGIVVPEPSAFSLILLGVGALLLFRRTSRYRSSS